MRHPGARKYYIVPALLLLFPVLGSAQHHVQPHSLPHPSTVPSRTNGASPAPTSSGAADARIQSIPQQQAVQPGGAHRLLSPNTQPGHLGEWLRNHQGMNSEQMEKALKQEPGFKSLPSDAQDRVVKQLRQLNEMPVEQRQRRLAYAEALERLSSDQKQQLRGALSQMNGLAGDRQRIVRKAMRDLRDVSSDQRQAVLNSPRFSMLTPQERGIIGNLLVVEP